MPLHKNQMIPLEIDNLASDGSGVGRFEGQAVFVPHSAVGDALRVRVVKPAKRYAWGRIEQVLTPAPTRIEPDCPVAGICGGCQFRHLSYEAELAAKRKFVADALGRLGGIEADVLPTLPSPLQQAYRSKVQYPVGAGKGGELLYGFYAPRSHRIVPCEHCRLQPDELNQLAAQTAKTLQEMGAQPYDSAKNSGLVRHLYLRRSQSTGQVLLCLVLRKAALPRQNELLARLTAQFPQLTTVVLNVNRAADNVILGTEDHVLYGDGFIEDELCGVPVRLGVHSFFQINPGGAARLFGVAADFAATDAGTVLLDLYCGTGVIGLSMAGRCKNVIGVEIAAPAVEAARESARRMGLANIRFLCADAAQAAQSLAEEDLRPDVVVLDPPRKGSDEDTLGTVVQMQPQRIVMVSCNPATLARDLAYLSRQGYEVSRVQPVDMFPRTRHVECVVLMTKKGGNG